MQGSEMKELRRSVGLSQAGLAERIGMARETIGQMERDQAPIEMRTALAVRWVVREIRESSGQEAEAVDAADGEGSVNELARALMSVLDRRYARIGKDEDS